MAFLDKKNIKIKIDCKDFKPYINEKRICMFSKRCANCGSKYIELYHCDIDMWGCTGISCTEIKNECKNV